MKISRPAWFHAKVIRRVVVLVFGMVVPGLALAYIGPGAGLTAIGTVLALIAALFLGIVGFVWYPIKKLLRKRAAATVEAGDLDEANAEQSVATEPQESTSSTT